MKKAFFPKRAERVHPPKYYESSISRDSFRRAMLDAGPLLLTQIAGMLSHLATPEAKLRHWQMQSKGRPTDTPIEQKMAIGMRRIVQLRLPGLINSGKVRKDGTGKESRYTWIENEAPVTGEDPSGRGHAKPPVPKRGRNPRVRKPDAGGA